MYERVLPGRLAMALPTDERVEQCHTRSDEPDGQREAERRDRRVLGLHEAPRARLQDAQHDGPEAEGRQGTADQIELGLGTLARCVHHEANEGQDDEDDDDLAHEDDAPGQDGGGPTAQDRTHGDAGTSHASDDGVGGDALAALEVAGDERGQGREHECRPQTFQDGPAEGQHFDRRSDRRQSRADCVDDETDGERPTPTYDVPDLGANEHEHRHHERIERDDALDGRDRRVEEVLDQLTDRDVHDRLVEHHEELRYGQGSERRPAHRSNLVTTGRVGPRVDRRGCGSMGCYSHEHGSGGHRATGPRGLGAGIACRPDLPAQLAGPGRGGGRRPLGAARAAGHGLCRAGRAASHHRPVHDRRVPRRVRGLRAVALPSARSRLLARAHDRGHHPAPRGRLGVSGHRTRRGMLAILVGPSPSAPGVARLGFVADLLSQPVRLGYMAGLAVTIFVSQLPKLFGFSIDGGNLVEDVRGFAARPGRDQRRGAGHRPPRPRHHRGPAPRSATSARHPGGRRRHHRAVGRARPGGQGRRGRGRPAAGLPAPAIPT